MNPSLIIENNEELWKNSLRTALKKSSEINSFFGINVTCTYPLFIPKELAQKIKMHGPNSVLWKQFIPDQKENSPTQDNGFLDPIGDQKHNKSSQLIHRYNNRALFLPTTTCPVICRYCFRKNELDSENFEGDLFIPNKEDTLNYLHLHPEIEEIIFSGGDPFIMSDEKIENYLNFFSTIATIKYIRFHTRVPVILPERITDKLIYIFQKFSNRFDFNIAIHCNHLDEISKKEESAIQKLSLATKLLSQTVMLKNINDDALVLNQLFRKFNQLGIRPYYLHHPDQVKGGMHFYLDQNAGLAIYNNLRRLLPGWLLPQYVVDDPEGRGKQAVSASTFSLGE